MYKGYVKEGDRKKRYRGSNQDRDTYSYMKEYRGYMFLYLCFIVPFKE